MPFLDYLIIVVFSLMILMVGLAFTRSGKNIKSYFAAGGALPWWLSGLSLFMSFFSAGTFVVWGSIAYQYGWVAITIQWMIALGGLIIGTFIAARWKKANILTVGEYIGQRFGERLKKFYSYVFLLLSFLTTGAFLYPVAKLFNVATGFSIELSIFTLGLIIIAYTSAGGLWSVIITDVLQFVILFAAVIIILPLAFARIGGLNSFIDKSPEGFFDLISGEYTPGFLIAFLLYNTIFIGGNWAYVQRYTSVKTPANARKVGWLFGALYLISPIIWMLPPMIYRSINGELQGLENEGAFLLICKEVLPQGLLGLMLGGMIFATASSVNTTLNMSAAVFTNDIFKKIKKLSSPAKLMQVARLSTVVFGLITIGVALMVPRFGGIVEVVLSVGAITGAPLFAPAIWVLFSRYQNAKSIIYVTLVSLTINVFFKFFSPTLFNFSLDRAQEMLVGVMGPLILLAFTELFLRLKSHHPPATYKPSEEIFNVANEKQENGYALKVLGLAMAVTGLIIATLGLASEHARHIVTPLGAIVLSAGILLYRRATVA